MEIQQVRGGRAAKSVAYRRTNRPLSEFVLAEVYQPCRNKAQIASSKKLWCGAFGCRLDGSGPAINAASPG
jgi:hypothetical protein